ncbi:hypothetical protein [Propionibacterium cyclohexanicum]|uniref:hypothetical protein n=1 Tax=Propionibacterium cyclohexanicum TaxID=64702 RepID=UPI000B839731|nr:hypothetical protein [Propionibacterium cyclohexanicum]
MEFTATFDPQLVVFAGKLAAAVVLGVADGELGVADGELGAEGLPGGELAGPAKDGPGAVVAPVAGLTLEGAGVPIPANPPPSQLSSTSTRATSWTAQTTRKVIQ